MSDTKQAIELTPAEIQMIEAKRKEQEALEAKEAAQRKLDEEKEERRKAEARVKFAQHCTDQRVKASEYHAALKQVDSKYYMNKRDTRLGPNENADEYFEILYPSTADPDKPILVQVLERKVYTDNWRCKGTNLGFQMTVYNDGRDKWCTNAKTLHKNVLEIEARRQRVIDERKKTESEDQTLEDLYNFLLIKYDADDVTKVEKEKDYHSYGRGSGGYYTRQVCVHFKNGMRVKYSGTRDKMNIDSVTHPLLRTPQLVAYLRDVVAVHDLTGEKS